jgi:hypothetical protein
MSDYNIRIDLSPYLPDSYLKDDVYKTMDKVDYTSYISINTSIFIFNINCSTDELEYYNDPGYLLYGIKKEYSSSPKEYFDYKVPPTYFFNFPLDKIINNYLPYKVIESTDNPNEIINDLLRKIGYNMNLLELNFDTSPFKILNFSYKVLECYDSISNTRKEVIYIFFNIKNLIEIDYNNYNSVMYYNLKYYNIFIYPFIDVNFSSPQIISLNKNLNLVYDKNSLLSKSTNYINEVDFDDRDIIKYYEKIDYKYMERSNYYKSQTNKLEILMNLSKNYKLYENYFINSKNENCVMISNNEISKTYFSNSDWENKNLNSYTLVKLNNNHVNNYLSFSGKEKKYSFTMDGKIAYVKKLLALNSFKYSPYNYFVINTPSIYQMSKNYYVNTYINITAINQKDLLVETNCYLYKILITINPNIINLLYLVSPDVKLSINSLFKDCNQLKFGNSIDKINLYFVNSLKLTNTFYINKYKIVFSFKINETVANYIIILGLCMYNGNNLNILNVEKTKNTDDLGYILFTNEDLSVSLAPQLYNLSNVNVYEQKDSIQLYDIKNYYMIINNNNDVLFSNYYTFLPFIKPDLINNSNQIIDNKNEISNIFDINISKINNFIKNLINLSNNILNLINNNLLLNFTNTITLDSNLEFYKYIKNYNYFPEIKLNSFLPNTINQYKLYNDIPQTINTLKPIPAGNYKIFKYKNFYPQYEFSSTSESNDKLVLTINHIDEFLKNNFTVFVQLPNNLVIDDKLLVDLSKDSHEYYLYVTNYFFNIGPSETKIFLVVSDSEGNPYVNSENIINGYELFNYYNSDTGFDLLENRYKIRLNLFISTYLNFFQMVFLSTIFKYYSEDNNSIIDIDNTKLILHNKDLLKDVVYYDFIRFNYPANLIKIKSEYDTYSQSITDILYLNKYYLNLLKTDINRLIFVFNTNKIVISLKKIYYYLKNYLILEVKNPVYINIINWLGKLCLNITMVNYNLGTTYSINNNYCQNLLRYITTISILTSLEDINNLIKNVKYIITYFENKIALTLKSIILDCEDIKTNPSPYISPDIKKEYIKINELIFEFELNFLILEQLTTDIDNLFTVDIVDIVSKKYPDKQTYVIRLLVESIINYLHLLSLNSKKIDELINTIRIISQDPSVDSIFPPSLNDNVTKNMFLFNTDYYTINLNIKNFNIVTFFEDYIVCIGYFADPINNSPISYLYWTKAIDENIIDYITNTITYLNLINNYIIGIYKFTYNITGGTIPPIDIMDIQNISNLYYLLTIFKENYSNMLEIIINNKINIFEEFNLVIEFFNDYVSSITDYLFYIEIKLYFKNLNTFNNNIFTDILKILNIEEFYTLINDIIKLIEQISNGDTTIINEFVNNAYSNLNLNNKLINLISIQNGNKNIYNILKEYIINSYIKTNNLLNLDNIITNIIYHGSNIVIIRDYNLLYLYLSNSSFNFNKKLLSIVTNSVKYSLDILDYYYSNEYNFYKQLINYNYLEIKNITVNLTDSDNNL